MPFVNLIFTLYMLSFFCAVTLALSIYGALRERRIDILLAAPGYVLLRYVHAWIYIEQFIREVVMKKRTMIWLRTLRVTL
jgi:hypothetical protein